MLMGWIEKGQSASFENKPISGLFFLDGDILARDLRQNWMKGQKYPTIVFPSGIMCDLWETRNPDHLSVQMFGEMDLALQSTRDEALALANSIAEQVGYAVKAVGKNALEVWGQDVTEHFVIIYDNDAKQIADVRRILPKAGEISEPPRQPLLDAKTREKLPPLNSQDKKVLAAVAQVKFFTPTSHWTWYATEASALLTDDTYASVQEKAPNDPDVLDIIFFGLVSGDALELGYFSLAELEDIRGPLGLGVERDRFFEPKTLKELQEIHREGGVG